RPTVVPEQEWVILRAAVWPDYVRPPGPASRTKFHVGDRHFINRPLVRAGDENKVDQDAVKEVKAENVLVGLENAMKELEKGTDPGEELPIKLCWLLHLAGDVHQPLHCRSFFSKEFPKGDQGGNFFFANLKGKTIKLHAFWDDLLGAEAHTTYAAIDLVA